MNIPTSTIKFRAIRNTTNQFVYGLLAGFVNNGKVGCITETSLGSGGGYHVNPETIGQYIEVDDKNGVEIYKGDILKCTFDNKFKTVEEAEKVYGVGNIIINPMTGNFCIKGTEHSFNQTIRIATKINDYEFADEVFAIAVVKNVRGDLHTDDILEINTYEYEEGNMYISGSKPCGLHDFSIHNEFIFNTFEVIGNIYQNPELLEKTNHEN